MACATCISTRARSGSTCARPSGTSRTTSCASTRSTRKDSRSRSASSARTSSTCRPKTHVFTMTTGAMKNAFGGLLNERRHWTHPVIHETLVDLLMIQKKIFRGVFAVMDGTFVGDGPGPRCMVPHVKNVLLASADQVAIDAVAAKLMGFDPLSIKFIRLAH